MSYHIYVDRSLRNVELSSSGLHLPFHQQGSLSRHLHLAVLQRTPEPLLDDASLDLLDIAASVFYADKCCLRKERENWIRDITIHIELRDPSKFATQEKHIRQMLQLLGGDNIRIEVSEVKNKKLLPSYKVKRRKKALPKVNTVALLSGGQDSALGALKLLQDPTSYPLFVRVNTRDKANIDRMTKNLRYASQNRTAFHWSFSIESFSFENYSKLVEDFRGNGILWGSEPSQRLRSFYFLSLASVLAKAYGADLIEINENSIMAIHIPLDPSRASTFSTRTAYPPVLDLFQRFSRDWLDCPKLSIRNQLVLLTKGEVIKEAFRIGGSRCMINALSCAHSANVQRVAKNSKNQPLIDAAAANSLHCGYCFPCILRRISMHAAGVADQDIRYMTNPFRLAVESTPEKHQFIREAASAVTSLIRFCHKFLTLEYHELISEFYQMVESAAVLRDVDTQMLVDVHRRFCGEVTSYIKDEAPYLTFLFDEKRLQAMEPVIDKFGRLQIVEQELEKAGVEDWNQAATDAFKDAFKKLRWKLQVALGNNQLDERSAEELVKRSINETVGNKPNQIRKLNSNHAREIGNSMDSTCRCPPFTGRR